MSTCKSYPAFADVTITDPIDGSARTSLRRPIYCPGSAGDIVVVRMFYQWPLFVTGLGYNISNLRRQQAAAVRDRRVSQRAFPRQRPC